MGHQCVSCCGYESVLAVDGSGLDSSVNVLYAVNKTLKVATAVAFMVCAFYCDTNKNTCEVVGCVFQCTESESGWHLALDPAL